MKLHIYPARGLSGVCRVPGDKSISHRAALIGAIARGKTTINNFLQGADCRSTLGCLQALGVKIEAAGDTVVIQGKGLGGLREPATVLDAGNSGTTIRLLLGLLTGNSFFTVITGDASLRRRPMGRVIMPLREMGAQIWGRLDDTRAPLAVKGTSPPVPIAYNLPVASAQVKSALLLAGLFARGTTAVTQPAVTRDHTERMLKAFGAKVEVDRLTVRVTGGKELQGQMVQVPGDISAAAFLLVAASILPGSEVIIREVGINPTRTGILDVLNRMGADITICHEQEWNGEPVADLHVRSAGLEGINISGDLVPRLIDEIPVVAVAAAVARGTTCITGAAELRVKETDRLQAIACELSKMGVAIEEKPDGLTIRGTGGFQAATVDSWGDHRMAMALTVAGLKASGRTVVNHTECIPVSFPGFQTTLKNLGAVIEDW